MSNEKLCYGLAWIWPIMSPQNGFEITSIDHSYDPIPEIAFMTMC